ncbi:ABC transporter permease subunit [Terrabacter sp. NPDC080008]|uniref:ABC transporter permease subunit n=1 Tax=Terrabacter sp. NPDC080008 TaxID=3155176 RepID=UPI00344EE94B
MSETLLTPDSRPRVDVRPQGTSFAGLVGVELRRLWWRRLTKVAVVAVVLFIGATVYNAYNESSPERIARQLDNYRSMQQEAPRMLEQCRTAQAEERDRSGDQSVDFGCDQQRPPTLEDMGLVLPDADTITGGIAKSGALLLAFVALLLGASFVGAEFATGSMGTWLTFQPRRLRVAASKLAAVAIGSAAIAALALVLANLGARMVSVVNRPGADVKLPSPPAPDEPLALLGLRVVALVVGAGLGGAALGLLLRHTAAIIGFVLGYGVVVEGFAVNGLLQGRLQPWSVMKNIEAFVSKGATYYAETCTASRCDYQEHVLTYTHGWVFLLCALVLVLVVGLVAFRRRDVG